MTTLSTYRSLDDALLGSMRELKSRGTVEVVRGMETREIIGHSFRINNPLARFTFLPHRKSNPFAQVAETMWMLAGREDLDWLEFYIPQCKKWSDDGKTWRDAYGPRLRHYGRKYEILGGQKFPIGWEVDQIGNAVRKLNQDNASRQIVLTLWNPGIDWTPDSKAYPCNIALQFLIRSGALHMFVTIRSNDVVYGFSHNDFFSWSVLHQMMAYWTNTVVGDLYWNATSFHVYERHYDLMQKIINDTYPRTFMYDHGVPTMRFNTGFPHMNAEFSQMFLWEMAAREEGWIPQLVDANTFFSMDPFIDVCTRMLMLYVVYKDESYYDFDQVIDAVSCITYSDFRLAAIDYLCRDERFNLADFSHLIDSEYALEHLKHNIRLQAVA